LPKYPTDIAGTRFFCAMFFNNIMPACHTGHRCPMEKSDIFLLQYASEFGI